jgi:hypothetical protein
MLQTAYNNLCWPQIFFPQALSVLTTAVSLRTLPHVYNFKKYRTASLSIVLIPSMYEHFWMLAILYPKN